MDSRIAVVLKLKFIKKVYRTIRIQTAVIKDANIDALSIILEI